jgi:uncharacterized membrane protein YqgA involved in biofilm formation
MTYGSDTPYGRSIPTIVTDLLGQLTTLVRQESKLARVEVSEKISQAALGLALIVGGAVLLMPALVILLEAAVAALMTAGFAAHWSALIVGGGVLVLGLIFVLVGVNRLKAENLMPNRTIHQLRRDAAVAEQQMRRDDDLQRAA